MLCYSNGTDNDTVSRAEGQTQTWLNRNRLELGAIKLTTSSRSSSCKQHITAVSRSTYSSHVPTLLPVTGTHVIYILQCALAQHTSLPVTNIHIIKSSVFILHCVIVDWQHNTHHCLSLTSTLSMSLYTALCTSRLTAQHTSLPVTNIHIIKSAVFILRCVLVDWQHNTHHCLSLTSTLSSHLCLYCTVYWQSNGIS